MTEAPSVNRGDELDGVLDTINKLARKARSGDYIYRGEPKHYDAVSSSLYREYQDIQAEHFEIDVVQKEILSEAKKYTPSTDEFEILTELQHYGGKTNLIDFTTDYLLALFFACDGSPDHDGRVILLRKSGEMSSHFKQPRNPSNRVIAQKSVFVRPPEGFIQPDHAVTIPKIAKHPLLDHLRNCHGISVETVYNDLHGFIRYQSVHQSASKEFYLGLAWQNRGNDEQAIKHYTRSINANPQAPNPYNNRGIAYYAKGELDRAIQDYDKALGPNPNSAEVFNNRGHAYYGKGEVDRAIRDYNKALELNPNYAEAYYSRSLVWLNMKEWAKVWSDLSAAQNLGFRRQVFIRRISSP